MGELEAIRTFLTVADQSSFSAAARLLAMTPASVTRTVSALERFAQRQQRTRAGRVIALQRGVLLRTSEDRMKGKGQFAVTIGFKGELEVYLFQLDTIGLKVSYGNEPSSASKQKRVEVYRIQLDMVFCYQAKALKFGNGQLVLFK